MIIFFPFCSKNDQSSHLSPSSEIGNEAGEGYVEEIVPQAEKTYNNHSATDASECVEVKTSELTRSRSETPQEEDHFPLTNEKYAQTKETVHFASSGSSLGEAEVSGLFYYLSGMISQVDQQITLTF